MKQNKSITIDGNIYYYEFKSAKDGDICLGTKNPEKYCNGFYVFSRKDPGNGLAFVVLNPPTKKEFELMGVRNNNNKIEKRVAEIRMAATEKESRKIVGYAAVFNKDSEDLGGFVERISPGAFSEAIGISDVRALFNHDNNMVLARNTSGTLELIEDETGLRYEFDAPNTSYGNDLLEMIKRGDVNQSSFGFTVKSDTWEEQEGKVYRTINKVNRLFDVSPVTFPAYPDASVAVRSMQEQFEENTTQTETVEFENKINELLLEAAIIEAL